MNVISKCQLCIYICIYIYINFLLKLHIECKYFSLNPLKMLANKTVKDLEFYNLCFKIPNW